MKNGFLCKLIFVILGFTITPTLAQMTLEYGTDLDDDLRLYCNRETAYSTGVSDSRKGLSRKEDFAEICTTNREWLNAAYNQGYQYGLTNQSGLIVNEPAPYHPEIERQLPSSQVQPYTRVVQTPNNYETNPEDVRNTINGPAYPGAEGSEGDNRASRSTIYPGERGVPTGDLVKPDPINGLESVIEVVPSHQAKCIETVNGQACGFNCVNSLNNVRCAATPDQVCRTNDNGDLACGYHCISSPKTVRCAAFSTDNCVADLNGYVFCGQNCRIEGNATGACDIERYAP
jgi:hypothetical protein